MTQLKKFVSDPGFVRAVQTVKQENKMKAAELIRKEFGVKVNPASIFDIQVKFYSKIWVKRDMNQPPNE